MSPFWDQTKFGVRHGQCRSDSSFASTASGETMDDELSYWPGPDAGIVSNGKKCMVFNRPRHQSHHNPVASTADRFQGLEETMTVQLILHLKVGSRAQSQLLVVVVGLGDKTIDCQAFPRNQLDAERVPFTTHPDVNSAS